MVRVKRLAALLVALALTAGNAAVCAGWTSAPQSRMACCAEGLCAMRLAAPDSAHDHGSTQADADRCCAASESNDSGQAVSTFVLLPATVLVTPPDVAPATPPTPVDGWRILAPTPPIRVARHLLLSVFLV
jgi:hypothetical protein